MHFLYLLVLHLSFPSDTLITTQTQPDFKFQYNLETPDLVLEMPKKLEEISGIGLSSNGRYFVAVQDELGKIFLVDKNTGSVKEEIDFWKDGDYEGAEMVGDDIYVVKSTGTIYEVKKMGKKGQSVEKYKFFLDKDNDVEGLGYDAQQHRLLLACKAKAGKGKDYKYKKGIYGFDLKTKQLDSIPAFTVSLEDVQTYLKTTPNIRKLEKIEEQFKDQEDDFKFSPSAIAIHPQTKDIYITSSVGKMLLVLNPTGKVVHIEKLKKKIHAQPEGLCFDKSGALYIANEAKKDQKAKIYKFNYSGF